MPRIVITHLVEDVDSWGSQEGHDMRVKIFAPFASDRVSYVEEGSNKVAFACNVHDMEGLMAFAQTPEAVANMKEGGVLEPLTYYVQSSSE